MNASLSAATNDHHKSHQNIISVSGKSLPGIISTCHKMHYQLLDVSINDAEAMVRQCQFPAMRQDPLRRIMFPKSNSGSYREEEEEEEEEEIKWTIEGLEESLENESCYFRQVTYGSSCVGFAIWTLESSGRATKQKPTPLKKRNSWNPAGLNVEAWNQVSMRLREERQRVLLGQQNIWSKSTSISTLDMISTLFTRA
jgi:hypothetical protein